MIFLNRSLSLRGDKKNQKISFFNGEYQEIETDNFEALWHLLELFSVGISSFEDSHIKKWSKEYGYTKEETLEILYFLREERLLTLYDSISDDSYEARNKRFYSIYKRNADKFLSTLKNQTILIMGVGTIGSTLALTLSKLGIGKIILVDNDLIELKNISAQAVYSTSDVHKDKTTILKKKLPDTSPQIEIYTIKEFVDKNFLENLPKLIEEHSINFAISCFDTGTLDIHSEIFKVLKKYNVNYILTGYTQNKVIAKLLDSQNEINEIEALYNSYVEKYYLGVNQGTILHSYASSIIISNLIQNKLGLFNREEINKSLEFDIVDIDATEKLKEVEKDGFYRSLSTIMESKIVLSKIEKIEADIKKDLTEEEMKKVEFEVLYLHQYFKLLELFDDSLFKNERDRFNSLFSSLTIEENSMISEGKEEYSPESYKRFVDSLEINGMKLHKVLTLINSEENREKKIKLQQKVFKKINSHSKYLIDCLVFNKKQYLLNKYERNDMFEVSGITIENIEGFERVFGENFEKKILKLFNLIFVDHPNEDTKFDYLYEIDLNNKISMSLEEAMSFQKAIFINNYSSSKFGSSLLSHLNKITNGNYILNQPNSNIFTTFYFPSVNESRIVVDYYDSMVVLQNLVHEIGHSYYNQYYNHNFFEKSQLIVNETLAILYEVIFHNTLFKDTEIDNSTKIAFGYHYLHRLNKMVISPFSLLHLENNIIDHIKENKDLSFDSFIDIRKKTKNELFPNLYFENEENSYANIFLNFSFVIDYKEGIISSMATTLAIYMFQTYQNKLDLLDEKIKEFLNNSDKGLDKFCECIIGKRYNVQLQNEISLSFDSHLNDISKIMGKNTFYVN